MTNTLFTTFQPSPAIAAYVQAYWQGDFNIAGAKDFTQSVLPNGCIELIVHTGSSRCALANATTSWHSSPAFTLMGLYERPYEVQFSERVGVFGIRFYPDGIRNIFGVPPAAFMSTFEDGPDVLGKGLATFCSALQQADSVGDQARLADAFIASRLEVNRQSWDYTHLAMRLIRQSQGMADYRKLTQQIPISVRQLQRQFKTAYGITLRDYMRLSRMNVIQNYMLSQNKPLTDLSYQMGFSDQSHFIKEYRHYTGMPPGRFAKSRHNYIVNPM